MPGEEARTGVRRCWACLAPSPRGEIREMSIAAWAERTIMDELARLFIDAVLRSSGFATIHEALAGAPWAPAQDRSRCAACDGPVTKDQAIEMWLHLACRVRTAPLEVAMVGPGDLVFVERAADLTVQAGWVVVTGVHDDGVVIDVGPGAPAPRIRRLPRASVMLARRVLPAAVQ